MRLLILILLLVFGSNRSVAQALHFKHLDMISGLSANQVYDLTTDHHGFLILATDQGLNRYDGRELNLIRKANDEGFINRRFTVLFKDSEQSIWIGSGTALYRMSATGEIVEEEIMEGRFLGSIQKLFEIPGGVLLVRTTQTWYQYDIDQKIWCEDYELYELTEGMSLGDLSQGANNRIVAVENGSAIISLNIIEPEVFWSKPLENASSVTMMKSGTVAAATSTGFIVLLEGNSGEVLAQYESTRVLDGVTLHNPINDIMEFDSGKLAYTTEDDGLYIMHPGSDSVSVYRQQLFAPNAIVSNQCVELLSDDRGNYFVTFLYNGIDYFHPARYFIQKTEHFVDEDQTYFQSYINSIAQDAQGKLWIGASDRVIEHDPETTTSKFHFYHEKHASNTQRVNMLLGFKAMAVDHEGRVWQGSFIGGIIIYDPRTGSIRKLTKHPHQGGERLLPSSYIWHIMQDRDANIWVSHNFGFLKIHPQTLEVDTLANHPVLSALPRKRSKYVMEDRHGRLWFGTSANGLYCYDKTLDSLKHYDQKAGFGIHCYQVKEDAVGRIYVAHENGFSTIYQDSIRHYDSSNGLRNRPVEGFLFDDRNLAYIANHSTIVQFDPEKNVFKYFDAHFGFGDFSFKANAMITRHDGTMLWGTEQGFIVFDPHRLEAALPAKALTIDKIHSGSGEVFTTSEIRIKKDDAITFEFTSIDLYGIKNIIYQYQLKGLNTNWINLGGENTVTFSSLPAGTYSFHVRASSNGLDWISCADVPVVQVSVPLHKNPYLLFLIFGSLALFAGLFVYQRLRVRSREAILSQQLAELEVKAIRAQMNPHFVFNALNSIQYFTYSGDVDKANEYLSDFARLMRLVLQQSRDGHSTLEEEIQLLSLYLKIEALRFNHEFEYQIYVDESIESHDQITLPGMLVQPMVENAVKHGLIPMKGPKRLDIRFSVEGEMLQIVIADNGIGIKAAQEIAHAQQIQIPHTSMGMSLVRKRLQMISASGPQAASLDIRERMDGQSGTVVTIRIPISHEMQEV